MRAAGNATAARHTAQRRSVLHVDLHPFFVSVERSLDPSLRERAVVIGGQPDGSGVVAAASGEARAAGVKIGQPVAMARRLCPEAAFLPGDFEAYARASQDITSLLLTASRRVERPSSDEAYVDLTREAARAPHPVQAVEALKDELQRQLGFQASLGLASSRLAARVASKWARPRGLLVVLPGYEAAFMARQPISFLELPPHVEHALERAGLDTLGAVAEAPEAVLVQVAGASASHLRQAALGGSEDPIALAAPPTFVREEALVRDRRSDADVLGAMVESLAEKASRRLRPFGLEAGTLTVEVERGGAVLRREESLDPPLRDEATARAAARALAEPLLEAPVRAVRVKLGRLAPPSKRSLLLPFGGSDHGSRARIESGA